MTASRRAAGAFAASLLASVLSVPATATAGAEADVAFDTTPTRVAGACHRGPGRVSVTVLPRGNGSYRVTVLAKRVSALDAQWRIDLLAYTLTDDGLDETVDRTFRRRPVDRSWQFSTDVELETAPPAYFTVWARRQTEAGTVDHRCLVLNSPDRPHAVASRCARGLAVLTVRQLDDGSLRARHLTDSGAPNERWRVRLDVESENSASASLSIDRADDDGVVVTRFRIDAEDAGEAVDHGDSVFTARAVSATGTRCWVRFVPGSLTSPDAAGAASARALLLP